MSKNRMQALAVLLICFLSITVCQACSSHTPAPSSGPIRESSTQESSIQKSSIRESEAKRRAEKEKIPDGTYEPSSFTVQGGTGKVTITCPEVVVTDGGAQACIVFSSPYYEWVETEGVRYDPENAQEEWRETSVFRIPVRLNEQRKITGLTTAMSEPHEVEYTIIIGLTRESPVQEGSSQEGPSQDSPTQNEVGNTASVSSASERTMSAEEADSEASLENAQTEGKTPPDLPGLAYVSKMETAYAETFDIYTYRALDDTAPSGLYRLIDVHGSGRYLLLPESDDGTSAEQGQLKQGQPKQDRSRQDQPNQRQSEQLQGLTELPASITVLRPPLDNLYVAATSSMALFDAAGAIGQVKLTGTKAEGWYIDAPKKALLAGSMLYAGKYSAPDYELLASSGCDLAVESMMILHTPEVKEKLEELGIPVFIDTSSNESHPLGRTEWVRLYGVLTGHEEEAEAFFETQRKQFAETGSYKKTGSSVAFFSISSNGHVIVRAADDYVPCMIGIAGGTYAFKKLLNETGRSASVRLSMEEFYNTAKDADYLIYNAAIEKPVGSIKELCGLSPLLADFKAVRSGRVWQVRRNLYQSPDLTAQMIRDIHKMLTEKNDSGMVFLEKIN
ncbi:MAG: ABC transporter substrate-binding protein [Eubacteriales bacterium]|nr:ABC transporter substrate-binding protein [Eubacteriales bacterium]